MAKSQEKQGIALPALVDCKGCIYNEDGGRNIMYCSKIKMPQRSDIKHRCINKVIK